MEENIVVQSGTSDEWNISGSLEGNINSKNLVIMIHGGGYDRHENGIYPVISDGKPKKELKGDRLVSVFEKKPYGNYDRLSIELQARDIDTAIFRYDVRNHGKSLVNNEMDTRDTSWERFARDLSSIIKYLKFKYGYENIHLVGTCMGALTAQYYITGSGKNETIDMNDRDSVKSVTLISPLANEILCTNNEKHGFNYIKTQSIVNGEVKQFTKMKGLFEGIETVNEARRNLDLPEKVASTMLPIKYVVSYSDRLIPSDVSMRIIETMKSNPNFEYSILNKEEIRGAADHCFYDPQSSDACLLECTNYLENMIVRDNQLNM